MTVSIAFVHQISILIGNHFTIPESENDANVKVALSRLDINFSNNRG